MAQHDYVCSDASGIAYIADVNNVLAAIASNNSGAAAPSTTYAYQLWADTTTGLLKLRNAANTGWIALGSMSATNLGLAPLAGATFTGPVTLPSGSTVSGYVPLASTGMRNLLINGNPVINKRDYVSGTATTSANQFTLDRWFVITSGQSVSWTDSNGIRTVTAPSGGMAQVIEGRNIVGTGTHVLNWTGTATATVNGAAVSKGVGFSLAGGVNTTVRFSSGTFAQAQLEPGSVATSFEERLEPLERALCQWYYQDFTVSHRFPASAANQTGSSSVGFPRMRATPTLAISPTGTNCSSITIASHSPSSGRFEIVSSGAGDTYSLNQYVSASSELTS